MTKKKRKGKWTIGPRMKNGHAIHDSHFVGGQSNKNINILLLTLRTKWAGGREVDIMLQQFFKTDFNKL